jgi:hypothetical protein
MSQQRLPPPEPEDCLIQSRVSRYKGGTLIAEDVTEAVAHRRRLCDPAGYRPEQCPRCGGRVLHVHDYPRRKSYGEHGVQGEITIVRHICAAPSCEATWRILPAFLARHLWRVWPTVERAASHAEPAPAGAATPIPRRTTQRWRARLASAAKQLVVLLATSGGALLETLAKSVGLVATREAVIDAYVHMTSAPLGRRLAEVAALVHRLERGVRLL